MPKKPKLSSRPTAPPARPATSPPASHATAPPATATPRQRAAPGRRGRMRSVPAWPVASCASCIWRRRMRRPGCSTWKPATPQVSTGCNWRCGNEFCTQNCKRIDRIADLA